MPASLENFGFGKIWTELSIDRYEGYLPRMSDYHAHEYYEISLILSGDMKILLPDTVYRGEDNCLLLTGPMTPHLVISSPTKLYKRINLLFSGSFLAEYVPEWKQLLSVFGKKGRVLPLDAAHCKRFYALIENIEADGDTFRRRLLLMLLLSEMCNLSAVGEQGSEALPPYVSAALAHVQEHYAERLVAAELALSLGVGRTTLMTVFKHYTGTTLNDYVTDVRLKRAVALLREGATEQAAAEACGLGDACNLIRCFRRRFGQTPKKYLLEKRL